MIPGAFGPVVVAANSGADSREEPRAMIIDPLDLQAAQDHNAGKHQ